MANNDGNNLLLIIKACFLLLLVFMLVIISSSVFDTSIEQLTKDPATLTGAPFYTGMVSYWGILLWCAAAVLSFFTCYITRRSRKEPDVKAFLAASGLVSLFFLLDDLFLFHETVFTYLFKMPEMVFYAVYVLVLIGYLVWFRQNISGAKYKPLVIALCLWGLSILIDCQQIFLPLFGGALVQPDFTPQLEAQIILNYTVNDLLVLLEDGFKLTGIIYWFLYIAGICKREVDMQKTTEM